MLVASGTMTVYSQSELEVVLQINANVSTRCNGPEGGSELPVVNPDLDVLAIHELVESSRMVKMEVADDDLLDIF